MTQQALKRLAPIKSVRVGVPFVITEGVDNITQPARLMLKSEWYEPSEREQDINLVFLRPRDYGFDSDAVSLEGFISRIGNHRVAFCPMDVGPILYRSYPEQEDGSTIHVVSRPILNQAFLVYKNEGIQVLGSAKQRQAPMTYDVDTHFCFWLKDAE